VIGERPVREAIGRLAWRTDCGNHAATVQRPEPEVTHGDGHHRPRNYGRLLREQLYPAKIEVPPFREGRRCAPEGCLTRPDDRRLLVDTESRRRPADESD